MSPIECESRIERVVVYARGAVVTRRVALPDALPEGPVALRVRGLTALADAGSVRALAEGDREVVALDARVVVPDVTGAPGALLERVRELGHAIARLEAERDSLAELRRALAQVTLDPAVKRAARRVDPAARFGDALAANALVGAEIERLDARLRELEEAIANTNRARYAAQLAAAQGTTREIDGDARPSLDVSLRLGAGGAAALSLEYVVQAARWWPAYTARFTAAATKVSLALDAFVAQASGEDWSRVKLSLSTADLAQDARLPTLRSLRFGRAQPPPRSGYRAPPAGLDELFAGYDRAVLVHEETRTRTVVVSEETRTRTMVVNEKGGDMLTRAGGYGGAAPEGGATLDDLEVPRSQAAPPMQALAKRAAPMAAPMRLDLRAPPPPPKSGGLLGSLLPDFGSSYAPRSESAAAAPEPEAPAAIEPADAWLDFDSLAIADASDRSHRGKLVRTPTRSAGSASVEEVGAPAFATDPLADRGRFDHRYDAEGSCEVPSSGRPHRVAIAVASADARPRFVAVPREAAEVYREAEIQNPFAAPLLSGPVDIFLDGALMTTTRLAFVDRRGTLRLGLGVEERLRVARNARVEEGSAGLLGGSTTVDHAITIDLASSLGKKATVEVLERVPVTDDKDVEIKIVSSRPEAERYTQSERGAPVRRGLRFKVEVPAGERAKIELSYRITLPAKNEIVGGNRRE
jgi:hypothetical protein